MKTVIVVSVIVSAMALTVVFGRRPRKTLEEKLTILSQCGLRLSEPFTVNDLLESWDRSEYEKSGYNTVLVGLGMTEEQAPWRSRCVNLWHFDTECIEGPGSYKRIAERMMELAQGSLQLEDISDQVDLESGKASFSFRFNGNDITIDCRVDDDWVDAVIFASFVEMLRKSDPSRVYIHFDLGGQDGLIGCVSRADFESLRKNGVRFKLLT